MSAGRSHRKAEQDVSRGFTAQGAEGKLALQGTKDAQFLCFFVVWFCIVLFCFLALRFWAPGPTRAHYLTRGLDLHHKQIDRRREIESQANNPI